MTAVRRLAGVAAALALLAACSSGHPAAATTTTSAPSDPTSSTTTTTTTLPFATDQDIRTRVPGVLTVGVEHLEPPWYNSTDPTAITSGFEFDIAKALAARLRVSSVKVVVTPLVTLLSGQDSGCDLMLNEVLVTDVRARHADLTEPYLTVDQAVLVRNGTVMPSIDDGRAFRWGVAMRNSAGLDVLATRIQPTTSPDVLVDETDGIRRLATGQLDAMVLPTPTALEVVATNPGLTIAGQLRTGELYAAVLTLGSPNTAALNDAIRAMRDDGTIALFLRQYFGINPADVPEIPS